MLRITADVNGKVIGHLFIHNTGKERRGIWRYDAALWNGENGVLGIEGVPHIRSDHWTALLKNVLVSLPLVPGDWK